MFDEIWKIMGISTDIILFGLSTAVNLAFNIVEFLIRMASNWFD